jgi:hypothetical protein
MRKVWLFIACLPVCASLLAAAPAYGLATLQDLSLDPNPILANGTSFGTVTLSEPAASDTTVTLTADPANGVNIPASVTVLTGQSQASFQIDDQGVASTTTISATLNADTVSRDLNVVSSFPHLVLNEVDYDQATTDSASFIEIYNASLADADLTDLAVVLVDGGANAEYGSRSALSSVGCLASGGYLVIANSGVVLTPGALVFQPAKSGDWIQNGMPDGVALVNTASQTVLDALSYEGSITAATITGFPGTYSLVEGTAFGSADTNDNVNSLQRNPNGHDTDNASADWQLGTPTPGGPNGGSASSVPGQCNRAPAFTAIGDRSVTAGQLLSFTVSATDADGDSLTYAASNLPAGAAFDSATRTFSWAPTTLQVGGYPGVHFTVSDGNAAPTAQDITITVNAPSLTDTGGGGGAGTGSETTLPGPTGSDQTPVPAPAPATAAPPPDTKILKLKVKRRTATVTFKGSTGATRFQCKLDKGRFKACKSPKAFKRLKAGKHLVRVRSLNPAGTADPTPAKKRFAVKR